MDKKKLSAERLLDQYPQDREEILKYGERIQKYSHACGCEMGAGFMSVAFVLSIVYLMMGGNWSLELVLTRLLSGIVFIFGMTALGKLVGMGLARIRLAFVYQSLAARFPLQGD